MKKHIQLVKQIEDELQYGHMQVDADWVIITGDGSSSEAGALEQLGAPGLWKVVTNKRLPIKEFAVPLYLVDQMTTADDEPEDARFHCLRRVVEWAMTTWPGSAPDTWIAPREEEISGWIRPDTMTVQCGDVASQGEIIRSEHRLALAFPIVASIAETLSPTRREKLKALLVDAHNTWRMTRVGFRSDGHTAQSAVVEIDLTGAPREAMESLVRYSIGATQHVVRWCAASAAALTDETKCELLDH
jgi:hypothetical protein